MSQNFLSSVGKIIEDDNIEFERILNTAQASSIQYGTPQNEYINYFIFLPVEEQIKNQIMKLNDTFEFDSKSEVSDFLLKNPKLIDVINSARQQIRIFFPEEKLKLKVEFDPEIASDSGTMFLLIVTKKEPVEAIKLLDKLNETWWLERKLETNGKLIIEEEYE
jgi:hypothetical protein